MEKGELQVAGKERESQLSSQFRDIATIVMEKTINTETQRPYTISMIERLMHEIHFAVDPNNSSKKQVEYLLYSPHVRVSCGFYTSTTMCVFKYMHKHNNPIVCVGLFFHIICEK